MAPLWDVGEQPAARLQHQGQRGTPHLPPPAPDRAGGEHCPGEHLDKKSARSPCRPQPQAHVWLVVGRPLGHGAPEAGERSCSKRQTGARLSPGWAMSFGSKAGWRAATRSRCLPSPPGSTWSWRRSGPRSAGTAWAGQGHSGPRPAASAITAPAASQVGWNSRPPGSLQHCMPHTGLEARHGLDPDPDPLSPWGGFGHPGLGWSQGPEVPGWAPGSCSPPLYPSAITPLGVSVPPACTPEMGCPDPACAPPGAGTQVLHEGWGAGAGWPAPHQGLHCPPSLCTGQSCDRPPTHSPGAGVWEHSWRTALCTRVLAGLPSPRPDPPLRSLSLRRHRAPPRGRCP